MWLRAWRVDLDRLVERLAGQGPIAFVGASKIWRGRRDRIARIALLKFETGAAPSLLRETFDRGDRIPPEASAAHGISGELPADNSGFAACAPRLEHFLGDCDIAELDVTGEDARFLLVEFVLADIESPITKARLVDAHRLLSGQECRSLEAFLRFCCAPTRENALGAGAATPTRATGVGRGVKRLPVGGPRRPELPGPGTLGSVAA